MLVIPEALFAQEFYFGNDLSYVNQMEDCGAVFKEGMVPKDPFDIFADHGCNLVRVRLWVDPSWWQDSLQQPEGVKPHYNDLDDVKKTIGRARAAGMKVMLGIQYSDFWADQGTQLVPRAWVGVAYDPEDLKDSVYNYTFRVLTELDGEGLMPDLVKVGNETNIGILTQIPEEEGFEPAATVSNSWTRHAQLFNAAIRAVRDVGKNASVDPRIVLHFSNDLSTQVWNYNNIISSGVTDFDIIGISYYYAWHGGSIQELESTIGDLVSTFPGYNVMVAETAYPWTTRNFDAMPNIVTDPDPQYLPVIPEKQLEYMTDYTRAVMRAGGIGVVFWEPAWVSTPCRTPWGVGSAQDHIVFFDPDHTNFIENGGGHWGEPQFYTDPGDPKVTIKLDMEGQDTSGGMFISGDWTGDPMQILPMVHTGGTIYSYYTYLPAGDTVTLYFLGDSSWPSAEPVPAECVAPGDSGRTLVVGADGGSTLYRWGQCESGGGSSEVDVTFMVSMKGSGVDLSNGIYLVGQITSWEFRSMSKGADSLYRVTLHDVPAGTATAYYYIANDSWNNYQDYRETVPEECANSAGVTGDPEWTTDRGLVVPSHDTVVGYVWGTCTLLDPSLGTGRTDAPREVRVYPNPATSRVVIETDQEGGIRGVDLYELSGRLVEHADYPAGQHSVNLELSEVKGEACILRISLKNSVVSRMLVTGR